LAFTQPVKGSNVDGAKSAAGEGDLIDKEMTRH
jgi:hypothetical protein